MKFFFSTVGRHNPALHVALPEHMRYPVAQRIDGRIDLDYTSLLLGEGFVIDGEVFQHLVEADREYLRPMVHSLTALREAGLLETVDMGAIIEGNRDALLAKTELLLERPHDWLPLMQEQWRRVQPEFAEFQTRFGSDEMHALNRGHPGVESWLIDAARQDDDRLREHLMAVLRDEDGALDRISVDDLRGMMRFVLAEVLATDLIRHHLHEPFLDWTDSQPFFDRLYSTRWETAGDEHGIRRQARLLFEVVIPELRPGNVEQVIHFVQDNRAVASLRQELLERLASGEEVSSKWLVRYLNAAVREDIANDRRMRKVRYLGSAAGLLLPGAGLAQEIASETATTLLESAADTGLESQARRRPRWYYALQQIQLRR